MRCLAIASASASDQPPVAVVLSTSRHAMLRLLSCHDCLRDVLLFLRVRSKVVLLSLS